MVQPNAAAGSRHRDVLETAAATLTRGIDTARAAGIRPLVHESWMRAIDSAVDPDSLPGAIDLTESDVREYRASHPLALALPVIHRLLIRHTFDAGLIIAIGDQEGRLLWIDGDRDLRRRAEQMAFVEGANWSERVAGTSAPGTALAVDRGVQIRGAEHYARIVHPWSCTAVPVHDPASRRIIGVIDITGGESAADPTTLPLLEATVAAVEAELHVRRLDQLATSPPATTGDMTAPIRGEAAAALTPITSLGLSAHTEAQAPVLHILGRDRGLLVTARGELELSMRHTELLALLAWYPDGISTERLAALTYERDDAVGTLRAELVRLKRVLTDAGCAEFVPVGRPYRLSARLDLDAHRVLAFLDRGAHRVALGHYAGRVVPGSAAPGVVAIRDDVSALIRDAMLSDAAPDVLDDYARGDEAALDADVWRTLLQALPTDSPRRTAVVTRLERIERDLS